MLLKVAIAILLAFVIAVPLTFWLLKKVRIKAKVRHVQVSLALGLPAALFVYLLQTSIAVPVVVITVAFSLLVVALELTLRRLIAKLPAARLPASKLRREILLESSTIMMALYYLYKHKKQTNDFNCLEQ